MTAEPVESEAPAAPAMLTRSEIIERITTLLVAEGQPPFTARTLATIAATSDELSQMLAALDTAGGLPGIAGMLTGGLFGKRNKRGKASDDDDAR